MEVATQDRAELGQVSKKESGGCCALPTRHRTGNALHKFVQYIKT